MHDARTQNSTEIDTETEADIKIDRHKDRYSVRAYLRIEVDASAAVSPLQSDAHPMVLAHFDDRTSHSLTVRSVPPVKRRRQSPARRRPKT